MSTGLTDADNARIAGRVWAEEVIAGVVAEHPEFAVGFWRRMKRQFKTAVEPPPKRLMRDEESRAFGQTIVLFGQHKGKRVDDVPLDYWEWLARQNESVQRYLASRRVQAEMSDDGTG